MESSALGGPPLLRQINSAHVLAALRGAGPLSLSDLAGRTGLSRPTVGQVVEQLHAAGLLAYVAPGRDGHVRSGRPARLVRFRSEAAYVVGIDIGRHKAHVMVADLAGNVVARHHRPTSAASSSKDLLAALRMAVREALADAGIGRGDVASVAAGTPGLVDWPRGAVVLAPGLPGWKIELARELRRSFRCPVQVENDANLAALAERRHGLARDAHTVVFILWGERVGAGVLIGDQVHRGAANAAGEIGFLALDAGTTAAPDALGRGPFERMVVADAIIEAGRWPPPGTAGNWPSCWPPRRAGSTPRRSSRPRRTVTWPPWRPCTPSRPGSPAGWPRSCSCSIPTWSSSARAYPGPGAALLEAIEASVRPLTLVPPRLELSWLGDEAVTLGAVELALADAERRLLPAPGSRPRVSGPGLPVPLSRPTRSRGRCRSRPGPPNTRVPRAPCTGRTR